MHYKTYFDGYSLIPSFSLLSSLKLTKDLKWSKFGIHDVKVVRSLVALFVLKNGYSMAFTLCLP